MNRQLRNAFLSLVQSLSPAEKRLISLNISKSGNKSTGVLDLIKLAQQLDTWDEELVRARIPASRLDHRIVYASEKIFQLLTEYQKRGHQSVIRNVLFLETAVEMNLEYFVIRFLKEVVKECEEKELWEIQIHAINTAIRFLQRSDSISRNQEFIELMEGKRGDSIDALYDYHKLCKLVANIKVPNQRFFQLTGELQSGDIEKLRGSSEYQNFSQKKLPKRTKRELLGVEYYYHHQIGKYGLSLDLILKLIKLHQQNEWLIFESPVYFFDKILFAIGQACTVGKSKIAIELIPLFEKYKKYVSNWGYYDSFAKLTLYYSQEINLNITGTFRLIQRKSKEWESKLTDNEILKLYSLCMFVSWKFQKFSETLFWGEKVLSTRQSILRPDLIGMGYLFSACCSFENGNFEKLIDLSFKGEKFIDKNIPDFKNSLAVLRFLKKLANSPLLEIKSKARELAKNIEFEENREFGYFDFRDWLNKFQ